MNLKMGNFLDWLENTIVKHFGHGNPNDKKQQLHFENLFA